MATAPALVIIGSTQVPADTPRTQSVLSGEKEFFFFKVHKHILKKQLRYCTSMGCRRQRSITRQEDS